MEDFIREFKKLEQTCNNLFDCDHGVTTYIDYMKEVPYDVSSDIPGWDKAFRSLKRVRRIRNSLVHDTDDVYYNESDIEFISNFRKKIEQGNDPLSIYIRMYDDDDEDEEYKPYTSDYIQKNSSSSHTPAYTASYSPDYSYSYASSSLLDDIFEWFGDLLGGLFGFLGRVLLFILKLGIFLLILAGLFVGSLFFFLFG